MKSITCGLITLIAIATACATHAQTADPKPLIAKAVAAVGGKDKLLTLFNMEELYHFGDQPEPSEGKKRSTRNSVLEPPLSWWVGGKERAEEPAKFDVWAWTLGALTDEKSKVEVIADLTDEGKAAFGLRVSGTVTPPMDLHFDRETNLLLRLDWREDFYRFSEWKEADGVKYASKTIISKKKSGKPWFFHEITKLERLSELPANLKRTAAYEKPAEKKPKPLFQYQSDGIEIAAATASEPKVKAFGPDTIRAAQKYLDDGAVCWVREKSCVACHSTGVYMAERPALTPLLGRPSDEVMEDFVESAGKASGAIQSVWRSLGLANWDKHVTGKLSEHTDKSLLQTLKLATPEGYFKTINQVEIPYITTHFELTMQAARAMATAPGWLAAAKDADSQGRIEKMKTWLEQHQPINDYELAVKLQLATYMPDLVSQAERDNAIAMLWRQQQPDGGWSTRRMSDLMKWHEKMDPLVIEMIQSEPDAANPASDAYMTAYAIVLLRESGTPANDERIQRGITWLKQNQRVSGRWWMKSLFRDTYHFITYISTAQALRALALCGEIPKA